MHRSSLDYFAMAKKNVFPIGLSYLSFNLKCIALIGAWNPYDGGIKSWLYKIYIIYYHCGLFTVKCLADLLQTTHANTLPEFTQACASVIVHIAGAIKSFCIVNAHSDIELLANLLNWEKHLACTSQMVHFRNIVMSRALASSKTIFMIISIIVLQNTFAELFGVLSVVNCTVTDFPLGHIPLNFFFSTINCRAVGLAEWVIHNFCSANVIIIDAFLMAFMNYLAVQFQLLNFRLRNSHKSLVEEFHIPEGDEKLLQNMKLFHFECNQMSDGMTVLDPNRELIKCIENHQKILEIIRTFTSFYNNILVPQLMSSLLLLSLMGCQLVLTKYNKDEDLHAMLHPLIFVTWAVVQLYIYCNGGNKILIGSEETINAAYSSIWYESDTKFQQNLAVFLQIIKPVTISISGVVDLSSVTFKNILSKAYSFMAILKKSTD